MMQMMGQWARGAVALGCAVTLAACGGGSDDEGASKSLGASYTVDPVAVTPVKSVAAKAFAEQLQGLNVGGQEEFLAFNSQQCASGGQIGAAVWETDNVVAYNQGSASDDQVRKAAQYGEASVLSLRDRYSIMPANGVGFDGQKVRICIGVDGTNYNGSAGIRTQFIQAPQDGRYTSSLIFHEMVHMVQAQALNCQKSQYRWERWLTEGMALAVTGQDATSKKQLASVKQAFADAPGGVPFGDINQGANPRMDRYPGYRLAVDTLLAETGATDLDLYAFFKHVGETQGCPGEGSYDPSFWDAGWKTEFDKFFGLDLRGQGVAGSGFWEAAERYLN